MATQITIQTDRDGNVLSVDFGGGKVVTNPKFDIPNNPPYDQLLEVRHGCNMWIFRDEEGNIELRPPATISIDEQGNILSVQFEGGEVLTQPKYDQSKTLHPGKLVASKPLLDVWIYRDEKGNIYPCIHAGCKLYCP